jgi:hypothetical protein
MKKINLNKLEKIIDSIDKKEKITIEKEYNIYMGNESYFKIITNEDLNNWELIKINKKSKRNLYKNISHREIFKKLLNIAINI